MGFSGCIFVVTKKEMKMTNQVQRNQKLVRVNDVLYYTDASNCEKWMVTELFAGGFTAVDTDGNSDSFIFSELQNGWSFSKITMDQNCFNYKLRYV